MIEFAGGSLSLNAHVLLCTLRFRAGLPRLTRKILCAPHLHKGDVPRTGLCVGAPAAHSQNFVRAARATRTGFVFRIYLKFSPFKVPAAQVYGSPRVYVSDDTDARDDVESGKCGCTSARRTCIRAMCHERVVAWHQRGRAGGAGGGVSGVGAEEVVREGRVRSGREE